MSEPKTYISFGDFVDLYYKVKQKGISPLLKKLYLSEHARAVSKWNTVVSTSDFWIIPEVRKRWNEKCTGNPDLEYEDYVVGKYFSHAADVRMLSVGCGTGARERKFAKYPNFKLIEGIDMASKQVDEARSTAASLGLTNLKYTVGDFTSFRFGSEQYDLILFNSSLHHFRNMKGIIQSDVRPLLKQGGILVIFEYVGPNRLQWTNGQLETANELLSELPPEYKRRYNSQSPKRKIYRPGLLRMMIIDPSEAVESASILPAIHSHFDTIEEHKAGWDITHLLFKDIAHNFLDGGEETRKWLKHIFEAEDHYLTATGRSDAVFGIYRK